MAVLSAGEGERGREVEVIHSHVGEMGSRWRGRDRWGKSGVVVVEVGSPPHSEVEEWWSCGVGVLVGDGRGEDPPLPPPTHCPIPRSARRKNNNITNRR